MPKNNYNNNFQPSAPVAKRHRSLSPAEANNTDKTLHPFASSRCGEVFVTNNADKWTFVCTFCNKFTGDIGVFICHIKCEHLNHQDHHMQTQLESNVSNEAITGDLWNLDATISQSFVNSNTNNVTQHQSKVPEIVGVTSLAVPEKSKTMQTIVNQNSNGIEENILPHDEEELFNMQLQEYHQQGQHLDNCTQNKEVYEVNYLNQNEYKKLQPLANACIMIEDDDDVASANNDVNYDDNESNKGFSYSLNGDLSNDNNVEYVGSSNDNLCIPTSSSGVSKKSRSKIALQNTESLPHKCTYCNKSFKSKQAIYYHIKTHDKKNQFQCPLCPVTHLTEHLFINHVLLHENASCFPCQVCGKVSPTNKERMEHLKTHVKERPFGCDFCHRRFRRRHFLTNHLRMHCQYQCDFCPSEFHSSHAQRRPYVCPACETTPEIRKKVEHQRSLVAAIHTFDSDQ